MKDQVERCIENGTVIKVGTSTYLGRNPVYQKVEAPGQPVQFVKVAKGVPFINVDKPKKRR